jgi:quercetin dioxygenase-like cupin family protein
MTQQAKEIIKFTGMEIHFDLLKTDTNDQLCLFKVVAHPGAKMGVPHYHEHFDETVYGLKGNTTYTIDGKTIELAPGVPLFIRRGVTHGFANNGTEASEFLCVITPPVFGPEYFREVAAILNQPGPPDVPKLKEILLKYGLVPVMA